MANINNCKVCDVLPPDTLVFETDSWTVSLSSDQGYLGRCFVTLREHKGDLAELTAEEWLDFAEAVKKIEGAVGKAFGPALFNWSCLMNNAFQDIPSQPHIHWHVRPRYEGSVYFAKQEFTDPHFAHHYDREHSNLVSAAVLDEIRLKIQENLT